MSVSQPTSASVTSSNWSPNSACISVSLFKLFVAKQSFIKCASEYQRILHKKTATLVKRPFNFYIDYLDGGATGGAAGVAGPFEKSINSISNCNTEFPGIGP